MNTPELTAKITDALNRHGKFTALAENNRIDIQHVDTGHHATSLWVPAYEGDYYEWFARWSPETGRESRKLPYAATVEEVVRAVATSVLDERRPKP